MSPDSTTVKFSPADAPMSAVIKRTPNRTVLLAANRGGKAVDISFAMPEMIQAAQVISEERSARVNEGKLTDHFEPYQVHVYEFARGK